MEVTAGCRGQSDTLRQITFTLVRSESQPVCTPYLHSLPGPHPGTVVLSQSQASLPSLCLPCSRTPGSLALPLPSSGPSALALVRWGPLPMDSLPQPLPCSQPSYGSLVPWDRSPSPPSLTFKDRSGLSSPILSFQTLPFPALCSLQPRQCTPKNAPCHHPSTLQTSPPRPSSNIHALLTAQVTGD